MVKKSKTVKVKKTRTAKRKPIVKKSKNRNLSEIAVDNKKKQEDEQTVKWLTEQAKALEEGDETLPLGKEDMWIDFKNRLVKNTVDKDSLDAFTTHQSIEMLECMYCDAQKDLLKAKRKAMVLEKVVNRAHSLLEEKALLFLDE